MKNLFFLLPLTAMLCFILCISCAKKNSSDTSNAKGNLSVSIGIEIKVVNAYSELKAGTTDDLTVMIFTGDSTLIDIYPDAVTMPENIELESGEYFIVACSDELAPAAFDTPYYYGRSENFTITPGETESVNITCQIANVLVSVVYSENVLSDFSEYATVVSTINGSLTYDENETRIGFFEVLPISVQSTLSYQDGLGNTSSKILQGSIGQPEPGKHYELTVNASLDNGNAIVSISLDEETETESILIEEGAAGDIPYGDLIITEIMYNPDTLSDTEGEWIEIYNASDADIDLQNIVITRPANGAEHVINEQVIMAPGTYAVLSRTASAVDNPDYVYGSSISLLNSGDEISIRNTSGTTICTIDYGAAGFPGGIAGCSIQLSGNHLNIGDATSGANWCNSTTLYSTGDYGTPAIENLECL